MCTRVLLDSVISLACRVKAGVPLRAAGIPIREFSGFSQVFSSSAQSRRCVPRARRIVSATLNESNAGRVWRLRRPLSAGSFVDGRCTARGNFNSGVLARVIMPEYIATRSSNWQLP